MKILCFILFQTLYMLTTYAQLQFECYWMCVCNTCCFRRQSTAGPVWQANHTASWGSTILQYLFWHSVHWILNSMPHLFISLPLIGIKSIHVMQQCELQELLSNTVIARNQWHGTLPVNFPDTGMGEEVESQTNIAARTVSFGTSLSASTGFLQ
jgi:hypothetical protein